MENTEELLVKDRIQLSDSFKKQVNKSIWSIFLFIIVYILIVIFAVALLFLCLYLGVKILSFAPGLIGLLLALGVVISGIIVLLFIVRFLFGNHKIDLSGYVQITREQEPLLFATIDEIVAEVGTQSPKKVFLSPQVNASVFYNSNVLSMFFPTRKNLAIGLGLLNATTKEEFRSILAHEFGHFSQDSMRIGSYVYQVNRVIYTILYDNQSFGDSIAGIANFSFLFSLPISIGIGILSIIQSILQKMYAMVNINYLALSREMEFHADLIASSVTGYKPLETSLLRLSLAELAYQNVVNFYDHKYNEKVISGNIFTEHKFIMNFLAEKDSIDFENKLPKVELTDLNKFNRSKLTIQDQWASHPTVEDRIANIRTIGIPKKVNDSTAAMSLLTDPAATQEQLTNLIYKDVDIKDTKVYSLTDFQTEYLDNYTKNTFQDEYQGYYDLKNPLQIDFDGEIVQPKVKFEDLYADERVNLVLELAGLEGDTLILDEIRKPESGIKSFDYDGTKYDIGQVTFVKKEIEKEQKEKSEIIKAYDQEIYNYFSFLEKNQNKPPRLKSLYQNLFLYSDEITEREKFYTSFVDNTSFLNQHNDAEEITYQFGRIKKKEIKLKEYLQEALDNTYIYEEMNEATKKAVTNYLSKNYEYYDGNRLLTENLELLYKNLDIFSAVSLRLFFIMKKEILDYQIELERDK